MFNFIRNKMPNIIVHHGIASYIMKNSWCGCGVGSSNTSIGMGAGVRSSNYNIGSEDDDTKYEKDYKDEDFSEGDDDYIPLDDEGFEFLNANKDECIDSLQGDVFFCLTLDGATYSKNKWKLSSDEDDVDLKVMKLLVVMIKVIRMK
jgi:hypothetical protein